MKLLLKIYLDSITVNFAASIIVLAPGWVVFPATGNKINFPANSNK
jgi:hypothetical protein